MTKVLIIGAGSAIAEATARCFAADGGTLHLIGRKSERLEVISQDLRVRGAAAVTVGVLDVDALTAHAAALDAAEQALGGIDVALIAHGTLPDQPECAASTEVALREFHTNAVATIALMNALAQRLERQGQGTLAVISSVAGDRGRQSNYLYGSAKAAVSTYAAGLRNRLYPRGIQVVTIKPGFVDTPMTAAFKKGALWATPASVGQRIHAAIQQRRDVVYVPGFWRLIMLVIRSIPEFLFKRLKL
jgi:decaprenylphospho-beta-D-erythro-pentofuranosid-2-ulose 2-reductase